MQRPALAATPDFRSQRFDTIKVRAARLFQKTRRAARAIGYIGSDADRGRSRRSGTAERAWVRARIADGFDGLRVRAHGLPQQLSRPRRQQQVIAGRGEKELLAASEEMIERDTLVEKRAGH